MKPGTRIKNGENLVVGCLYRITQIDPHDPSPSLRVGALVRCAPEQAGCIDPENHESDGMGTQWFADFGDLEVEDDGPAYRTLVTGLEFVRGPAAGG
jgi:hypothetical protein